MRKILIFLIFLNSFAAHAFTPEEQISDPIQEERAQKLFMEIRCLSCQGQVIGQSDSSFSASMRELVREKIISGQSDKKIRRDLRKEFGNDILINPNQKSSSGIILWLTPLAFAAIFAFFGLKIFRHEKNS
jgi:cytochrome c-type biogenesis protein CcmH